jgi:flagellum-specific peptidoglycan hydrolase FlgJ
MATPAEVSLFINKMAPIAVAQAKKHGNKIFPSVCIAQACCESAYGTSPKMKRANAVFGIKVGKSKWHFGSAWKDKAYSTATKECYDGKTYVNITDMFRAYESIEDATEDYFDMLCTASRYKAAVNAADYKACIRAIAPSYATAENKDHSYSKSVIKIIETYNLTKYDEAQDPNGNPYNQPSALLKKGSRGNSVRWLQYALNKRGAHLIVDGAFGEKTRQALIEFQKSHNLVPDGICGPLTIRAIASSI